VLCAGKKTTKYTGRSGASPDQPWPLTRTTPTARDPHPRTFPAEAGLVCISRLSPPGKRRVRPHWAPKAAPRRRGRFPTWPHPEGRGTAPDPDQTRRRQLAPVALSQMGVIHPARSPHPGSQASWECTTAQKAAFVCTNLVSIGTLSNADCGLAHFQRRHECRAWDLVSKMP
jgi:hypothetical protein